LNDDQASKTFRFGFLRGGVRYGWPSGHMMANTAAVMSLLSFYNKTWLDIAGSTYLAYMFLSVMARRGSTMHWLSDAIAGTLMGYAIGTTVGRDFRRRWENKPEKTTGLSSQIVSQLFSISVHFSWAP
jgi:membrane-associated phospholipid phosphatase